MNPVKTITTTLTIAALTSLTAFAGPAQAQSRPLPPPVPQPAPVPMPRVFVPPVAVNIEPMIIDLPGFDQVRALNLDDLRMKLADVKVALPEIPMPVLSAQTATAVQSAVEAARISETTREAMDHARLSMLDANWHQTPMVYNYQSSGGGDYSSGKDLLMRRQYEQAIVRFDRVIARKEGRVDGALYHKAYSLYKLGKNEEALATIATLRKEFPQSAYLQDAKILETDARRGGKPANPAEVDDDELKVLALQGLVRTNPDVAVAGAENLLKSTNSLVLKKRALYVLAQATQPNAYQVLLNYAKGGGNPDLQLEAISYLAANRNNKATSADLMAIYQSTSDTDVKMAIISALRSSGNQTALTQIVSSGNTPVPLRMSALNSLTGAMSPQDLWTLYEKESNKDLKMHMVSAFSSMQAIDYLNRIVKTEKDPEVRRRALRSLGNQKSDKTGQILVDLYGAEQDVESKKTIISSLASQSNAEGLVAIARKETTLALKTDIVRRISDLAPRNKVAADYLMEIIK